MDPNTGINVIENFLDKINLVLVMSVHPGFGGQKFMPEVLKKIKDLHEIKTKISTLILKWMEE